MRITVVYPQVPHAVAQHLPKHVHQPFKTKGTVQNKRPTPLWSPRAPEELTLESISSTKPCDKRRRPKKKNSILQACNEDVEKTHTPHTTTHHNTPSPVRCWFRPAAPRRPVQRCIRRPGERHPSPSGHPDRSRANRTWRPHGAPGR